MINKTLEYLDLSVKTHNVLLRAGIRTVKDLCERSESNLLKIRNMGSRSVEEIKEELGKHGLKLEGE